MGGELTKEWNSGPRGSCKAHEQTPAYQPPTQICDRCVIWILHAVIVLFKGGILLHQNFYKHYSKRNCTSISTVTKIYLGFRIKKFARQQEVWTLYLICRNLHVKKLLYESHKSNIPALRCQQYKTKQNKTGNPCRYLCVMCYHANHLWACNCAIHSKDQVRRVKVLLIIIVSPSLRLWSKISPFLTHVLKMKM